MRNPTDPIPTKGRITAGTIAIIGIISLGLQSTLGESSVIANAGGLMRYFTIWGNVAACVAMGLAAMGRQIPRSAMAALATALTVIGLVYWALLAADHHPVGLDRMTNQVFHTFVPLATVLWWLRYTPRIAAIIPALPMIMAPPLAYGLFAFVLGEITGFYAYFFLDLPALGWLQFLISNIVLAIFFAMMGAGLVAIKRAITSR